MEMPQKKELTPQLKKVLNFFYKKRKRLKNMRKRLKNFGNASEKKDETIQLNRVFKFFENRERLKKKKKHLN